MMLIFANRNSVLALEAGYNVFGEYGNMEECMRI